MGIDEIKNLVEKFVSNFEGSEDFAKIKANGLDLVNTLDKIPGGLSGIASSLLGKIGGGDSNSMVEKLLSGLGSLAKTDSAKTDFSKLQDAVKKFIS